MPGCCAALAAAPRASYREQRYSPCSSTLTAPAPSSFLSPCPRCCRSTKNRHRPPHPGLCCLHGSRRQFSSLDRPDDPRLGGPPYSRRDDLLSHDRRAARGPCLCFSRCVASGRTRRAPTRGRTGRQRAVLRVGRDPMHATRIREAPATPPPPLLSESRPHHSRHGHHALRQSRAGR